MTDMEKVLAVYPGAVMVSTEFHCVIMNAIGDSPREGKEFEDAVEEAWTDAARRLEPPKDDLMWVTMSNVHNVLSKVAKAIDEEIADRRK